jgi:hypothetical protein
MTAAVRPAQIPKVGDELRLIDLPPVEVGPEQVRASVQACGIRHSDRSRPQSRRRSVFDGQNPVPTSMMCDGSSSAADSSDVLSGFCLMLARLGR